MCRRVPVLGGADRFVHGTPPRLPDELHPARVPRTSTEQRKGPTPASPFGGCRPRPGDLVWPPWH
ncbi:hypothetical protein B005_2455 [Nocardiopsis alba ATCC BAA-2165]|uniref:Uncharacterized protein n=1 Tax=Nocardiopsis alba (strain ATCC BAA-2165 / BE74) TaxID=1205910 RepID=J7L670_NOCAA|nr:hypothetical protein B005_2455 [Nocardiopsis alba ATCC BAA-2165]